MKVNLKKNGWHRRLQEYVFDSPPRYGSLCPYFWFTVFCIFAFPFVGLFKAILTPIAFGFLNVVDKGLEYINKKVCVPLYESQLLGVSEETLLEFYIGHYKYHNCFYTVKIKDYKNNDRFNEFRRLWLKKNNVSDHKDFLDEIVAKLEMRREIAYKEEQARIEAKNRKAAEKHRSRDKMFANIVKYTQWIAPTVATIFGVFILYGIYLFARWVGGAWQMSYWPVVGKILLWILAAAVAIFIIAGIVVGISVLVEKCDLQPPKFIGNTGGFFKKTGRWIGSGFMSVVDFFKVYFKAAKDNYCPMIDWD